MRIKNITDVRETKRTALLLLIAIFCNEPMELTENEFSIYAGRANTEDLVAALELPEADRGDCETWGLSPEELLAGIRQALYLRIVEALHSEREDIGIPEATIYGKPGQC